MTPDAAIAERIADLQTISSLGWGFVFALALLFWWVDRLREKGCPNCAHCIHRNRARKEADEKADEELRERLFGRQMYDVWKNQKARRREDDDEGPPDDGGEV